MGLWSAFQVCLSGPSLYGQLWRVPISSPNPTPDKSLCSSSGLEGPFSDLYWHKEHVSLSLLTLGHGVYESGENHTFWKLCLHLDTDTVVKVTISVVPGRIQTLRQGNKKDICGDKVQKPRSSPALHRLQNGDYSSPCQPDAGRCHQPRCHSKPHYSHCPWADSHSKGNTSK